MKKIIKAIVPTVLIAALVTLVIPIGVSAAERNIEYDLPERAVIVDAEDIPEGAVITPVEIGTMENNNLDENGAEESDTKSFRYEEEDEDGSFSMEFYGDDMAEFTEDMDMEDLMSFMYMMMLFADDEDEPQDGPLTPDGNLTLVDDYGSPTGQGKQFITITTKTGEYFYLIIDRDDSGNETVHFLNQVDNTDILAYLEDEEVAEYDAWQTSIDERKAQLQAEEDALKAAREALEKGEEPADVSGNTDKSSEDKPDAPVSIDPKYLVYVAVIVIFGIVAFVFMKKNKKKPAPAETEDEDPWDDYDDETEDTETADVSDDEKTEEGNEE